MFVIGVAGQAQMGKDTISDRLAEKLNESEINWERTAFALNVKRVYAETFAVDYDFIEKWKTDPNPPPGFDMTVRKSLQFIGDGFRKIKEEIWIDLCFRTKNPKIISDVRYVNEFRRIYNEGGLNILVGRTEKLNNDPNGSEAQIRPYVEWFLNNTTEPFNRVRDLDLTHAPELSCLFDVFIRNDGTKDDLHKIVDEQIIPHVQSFVFDFDKKEGSTCHTLS